MYPSLSNQLFEKKDVNKSDAILIAKFFFETRLKDNFKVNLIENAKFMTHSESNQLLWNKI